MRQDMIIRQKLMISIFFAHSQYLQKLRSDYALCRWQFQEVNAMNSQFLIKKSNKSVMLYKKVRNYRARRRLANQEQAKVKKILG